MFRSFKTRIFSLALALAATTAANANVPNLFSYQGRIAGQSSSTVSLTVKLWDAQTGGTQLFSETQNNVPLADGIFSIIVGGVTAGGIPDDVIGGIVWMSLSVNGAADLSPRTRLTSVPYAIRSERAQSLVIPGASTLAATVESDGHVILDGKVEIGAADDNGGAVMVRNAVDTTTVRLDGAESAGGGRIEVKNGASTNIDTIILDGNEDGDGALWLYDANNFEAVRIHSDYQNDAPELSLFAGTQRDSIRETVQIAGNFDPDSAGAGEVRLRRVNDENTAVTTAILAATGDSLLDEPTYGGILQLNYSDGSPVFTVKAGAGSSALIPAFMELRNVGENSDQHLHASPSALSFYNTSNDQTISLSGYSGDATFDGEVTVGVLTITGGADLSEQFDIRSSATSIEPGMVVCIDPKNPGELTVSDKAYDHRVAGVISGAGGVKPGMMMS